MNKTALDQILPDEMKKAGLTRLRFGPFRNRQSAAQTALRSMLAKRFEDHKVLLSEALAKGLVRLNAILSGSRDKSVIRDATRLLHRAKTVSNMLGLKVNSPPKRSRICQTTSHRKENMTYRRHRNEKSSVRSTLT